MYTGEHKTKYRNNTGDMYKPLSSGDTMVDLELKHCTHDKAHTETQPH